MRSSRLVTVSHEVRGVNHSLQNWCLVIPSQFRLPQSLGLVGKKLLMEIHVWSLSF